ncbi:signal peptidase I [bacterium]|nr:signal peptidase I [candidate division CSSED10-310 bacterium]
MLVHEIYSPGTESDRIIRCDADHLELIREILVDGSKVRIQATGRSMGRLIRSGDIVTLTKVSGESLQRGDIVFFRTQNDGLFMHRVVEIERRPPGVTQIRTMGDSLGGPDEPVPQSDILGRIIRIEKPVSGQPSRHIDLQSFPWPFINRWFSVFRIFSYRVKKGIATARKRLLR